MTSGSSSFGSHGICATGSFRSSSCWEAPSSTSNRWTIAVLCTTVLGMKYDGYAALLYVDRRGAPENRQMGFDLEGKIELLHRIMKESRNLDSTKPRLWITEVNWPLRDTGAHSPSLGASQVGEDEQLRYLVRYYLLALATGKVEACYWHQLVAPGYGLIDNRGGTVRERSAFRGFATLCRLFNGARIERFSRQDELGHYRLTGAQGRQGDHRPLVSRPGDDRSDAVRQGGGRHRRPCEFGVAAGQPVRHQWFRDISGGQLTPRGEPGPV